MKHPDPAQLGDRAGGDGLPAAIPPPLPGLAPALALLAADLNAQPAPPLSARARQAARRHAPPRPVAPAAAPRWRAWGFSGAAVCALALLGSVLLVLLPPPSAPAVARLPGLASGFITVASAERWEQLLQEDATAPAWLVATELPRERLAALGLPFDPARAGDRVSAELLMHPSGEVLAVRVLSH